MPDNVQKPQKNKVSKKSIPISQRARDKLGLVRDWDFILHFPFRFIDETSVTPIASLIEGHDALIEGHVASVRENKVKGTLEARVEDDSDAIRIFFLHCYPSLKTSLAKGNRVRLYGTPKPAWGARSGELEMLHPKVKALFSDIPLAQTLTPVYRITEGMTQTWLRRRIDRAIMDVDITDLLSEEERKRLGLMGLKEAVESLHHPAPGADLSALENKTDPAWERIKFDELLAQQIALHQSRKLRNSSRSPVLAKPQKGAGSLSERFYRSLPFSLTSAQRRVWGEILNSLNSDRPSNRLVQGDVGCGKTVIAALAACQAIDAGFQTALMAPTEILAAQHFKKIADWLEPFGVRVAWLAGSQKAKEKRETLEAIAEGAELVVGTHALISEAVTFKNLGLAIVDEQHRFGVDQRLALRQQKLGGLMPHLLMLSATPIPRTLAMGYLSDLDISVIDELPPGRQEITTKLISQQRKDELIDTLGRALREGAQAYWVCPLIEESEKSDLTAATETLAAIKERLPDLEIELLHGKMTNEEKSLVMEKFQSGQTQMLVSTTVIEVGVDVPNASYMVIEHAERFGLAQLHQLRGRVGRGSTKSYCIALFGDHVSKIGKDRLQVFKKTCDGFKIAEKDLELRGPGEFLGCRQSGAELLRFADLGRDALLVEKASRLASEWVTGEDPRGDLHAGRWYYSKEKYLEA